MLFFICYLFLAQSTAKAKNVEIACEQFRVVGDLVYCVDSNIVGKKNNRIVSCYLVKQEAFEKKFEFECMHTRLDDVLQIQGKIYCVYKNGVVEQRDSKSPDKIESELKLSTYTGETSYFTLFPDFSPAKELSGILIHRYTSREEVIGQRIAKVAVTHTNLTLDWDNFFNSKRFIPILKDGFYVIGKNKVTKHDLATGKPVSEMISQAAENLRSVGQETLLIYNNKNDIFEFWDRENLELKRRMIVPDSYWVFGNVIAVKRGKQYSFRDLNGAPLERYPAFSLDDGRIRWVKDEKICIRKKDGSIQIIEMSTNTLVVEALAVDNFFTMSNGQYLTSKATTGPKKFVLTLKTQRAKGTENKTDAVKTKSKSPK